MSAGQAAKVRSGKMKNYGEVRVRNKDGHDVIREDLYELVKEGKFQQFECLMNLPGGAVFFLPTFRG